MNIFDYGDEDEAQRPIDYLGLKITPPCIGECLEPMRSFPYADDNKKNPKITSSATKKHFPSFW